MFWLDRRFRCNRCGTRLPDEKGDECPDCHAAQAEVGVSNGLTEWARERRAGRARFVGNHVLMWGATMVVATGFISSTRGSFKSWPEYAIQFVFELLAIYGFREWLWRSKEAEFKTAGFKGDEGFDHLD